MAAISTVLFAVVSVAVFDLFSHHTALESDIPDEPGGLRDIPGHWLVQGGLAPAGATLEPSCFWGCASWPQR